MTSTALTIDALQLAWRLAPAGPLKEMIHEVLLKALKMADDEDLYA